MRLKGAARAVFIEKLILPVMDWFFSFEQDVLRWPQAIRSGPESATRFNIPEQALKRAQRGEGFVNRRYPGKFMPSLLRNMRKSVRSLAKNPHRPHRIASTEFFAELVTYAKTLGVSHVGYAKLSSKHVFQGLAVLYENAIVLAMEMAKEQIDMAPSYETMAMIMKTYDDLGIAANKIAEFLRKRGFGAHASHPLGGLVLYPPLGQISGIGYHGRHGLIITPEFGPRIRLTAVFTSIKNLPYSESNEHAWIREYCESCLECVRSCPPRAILEKPIQRGGEKVSYTNPIKCFPYFVENFGCSVCIKVCPFSDGTYQKIKAEYTS